MMIKKNNNNTTDKSQSPAQNSNPAPKSRNTVSPWISSGLLKSPASPRPLSGETKNISSPWPSQNHRLTGNNNILENNNISRKVSKNPEKGESNGKEKKKDGIWNKITDFASDVMDIASIAASGSINVASSLWTGANNTVSTVATGVMDTASNAWTGAKKIASTVVSGVKDTATNVWTGANNTASTLVSGIKDTASDIWVGANNTAANVVSGVKNASNVWDGVKNTASAVTSGVKDTASNVWGDIKDTASNVWGDVKDTASNVWGDVKDTASNVWSGVKDTTSNVWSGVKDTASNVWSDIKGTAANVVSDVLEMGQDGVSWLQKKDILDKNLGDTISAAMEAGQSTLTNHDALVAIANEFGTTFGKADHSDERNITIEQAAVLASHIYNIDEDDIGKNVADIYEEGDFGGIIDDSIIPDEFKQVEGMENFTLEDIKFNKERGSGDLKMGIYSQTLENGEKEYYIVNMGTKSKNGPIGWKNNFENIDGNSIDMKDSIDIAREICESDEYKGSKITMIGHSKGGGEAAANAVATNNDAILFNPNTPFLSHYMTPEQIQNYPGDMSMYVTKGEILDVALSTVGYRGGVPEGGINYLEPKYKLQETDQSSQKVNKISDIIEMGKNCASNHGLDSIVYGLQQQSKGANKNE